LCGKKIATLREKASFSLSLKTNHMDIEQLQEYCLSKPGAEETLPFGPDTLVYKVANKAFLLTSLDNEEGFRFNVKCDPGLAEELREEYTCVQPGYHMNKKHWNTIVVDGSVPVKMLKQWIDHSYELVVESLPKKLREQLK
jgi:predicted DNA-binding protein (MmcQ/YjbR family)